MDISAPLLNGAMLAVFTAILAWLGKSRFDGLERRIDRLEERFDRDLSEIRREIVALRTDLTQIALAVGVRPQTG